MTFAVGDIVDYYGSVVPPRHPTLGATDSVGKVFCGEIVAVHPKASSYIVLALHVYGAEGWHTKAGVRYLITREYCLRLAPPLQQLAGAADETERA